MTTEEHFIQPDGSPSDDEVARLVRLAGPTGLTGSIAPVDEARLARVRTAVHGAWRDEYVVRTRRRRLTVGVLLAAAASLVFALAIRGPIRQAVRTAPRPRPLECPRRSRW